MRDRKREAIIHGLRGDELFQYVALAGGCLTRWQVREAIAMVDRAAQESAPLPRQVCFERVPNVDQDLKGSTNTKAAA